MKFLTAALVAAASTVLMTAASAAPLSPNLSVTPDSNVQNVRERYIERRGYEERSGIGFRAPGVSVGIGTDRY